jgi:peptide/nickel transport system permease protein
MRERHQPYISGCVVQGMSGMRICVRHLVPNVLPIVIAQTTIMFGYAIVHLAAISYLGLGVGPGVPDWGGMVANGQQSIIAGHPQESLYAGALLVIEAAAFTILGDRLGAGRNEGAQV